MSVSMLMLIPFPVIAYINRLQKDRYFRPYLMIVLMYEVLTVAMVIGRFLGMTTYRKEVLSIACAELVLFGVCVVTLVADVIRKRAREYILSFIATLIFSVYAIIEVILYIVIEGRHAGTGLMIGTYAWIVFAILEQLVMLRQAKDPRRRHLVPARRSRTSLLICRMRLGLQ